MDREIDNASELRGWPPEKLSAEVGAHHAGAATELCRRYRRPLLIQLERLSGDPALAEDLTQETLIVVLERLKSEALEDPAALGAFVRQTARYQWANWSRREFRRQTHVSSDVVDALASTANDPFRLLSRSNPAELVALLLKELRKPRDREVIRRVYLLHQDKAQICRAMLLRPAAFDRVLSRARGRLRDIAMRRIPGGLRAAQLFDDDANV
ncbi:MAG: sigma-70 family RNA polymerase sigma factor [Pseudomonadaceae bacterium]|nr:sigma-70 family RNA polymerase sigma factor [Pseudomonadaceae bacterium]